MNQPVSEGMTQLGFGALINLIKIWFISESNSGFPMSYANHGAGI